MQHLDLIKIFTRRFDDAGAVYMVTGSVAAMIYGEPRFTNDIDLVVSLPVSDLHKLEQAFPSDLFYLPPMAVIVCEFRRMHRGHVNIIHHESGYKADVYAMGNSSLHRWGMDNRKHIELPECAIQLAPIEYVIIRKLEYFREGQSIKHIQDIRNMLELSSDIVRFEIIEKFIAEGQLQTEWSMCTSPL